jgi:hypothetical protein
MDVSLQKYHTYFIYKDSFILFCRTYGIGALPPITPLKLEASPHLPVGFHPYDPIIVIV